MFNLNRNLDNFLRALDIYLENPSNNTKYQLRKYASILSYAIQEHDKELERRVTANVLKELSMKLESSGAINEIQSLKKAIDDLER